MRESSVQAELLRLQCLQALGITVYHPRFVLPGAKPSEQGPWPEADQAVIDNAAAANSMPSAEKRPVVEQTLRTHAAVAKPDALPRRVDVEVPDAPAKRPAPVTQAKAPHTGESTQAAVQNFQLLFLQIDDDLAIVNQIPALARPQLQEKQLVLLANILRWLGKTLPAQTPRMFRWPLPGLEHMAVSMNAQTSLLHFLEQAASERGFRFLLQLGPQAMAPAASAWQAFSTHSLDEMLALPSLKREVWQSLLPLHESLHAGR